MREYYGQGEHHVHCIPSHQILVGTVPTECKKLNSYLQKSMNTSWEIDFHVQWELKLGMGEVDYDCRFKYSCLSRQRTSAGSDAGMSKGNLITALWFNTRKGVHRKGLKTEQKQCGRGRESTGEGQRRTTLKNHAPCDQLRKTPQGQIT